MNDRYLFKAKHIHILKNSHLDGIWVKGYLVDEKYIVSAEDGCECLIDPQTICQCTGLKDKNGNLIWENDFVQCGGKELVVWDERFASWCLIKEGWAYKHFFGEAQMPEDCEVVGNKFDNPELLEECDTD